MPRTVAAATTAEDVKQTKPAPDNIFSVALSRVAPLTANEIVVVGDSPYDVEAATRCSISAIALRSGKFSDEILQAADPAAILDDVSVLVKDFFEIFPRYCDYVLRRALLRASDATAVGRAGNPPPVCGPGQTPRGRLRLDVIVTLAKLFLIPNLPQFMQHFSKIDLIFGVSDQPADLLADGIDCVLRLGDIAVSSIVSRVVGRMRMVTCTSPAYLAKRGTRPALRIWQVIARTSGEGSSS